MPSVTPIGVSADDLVIGIEAGANFDLRAIIDRHVGLDPQHIAAFSNLLSPGM